MAGNPFASDHYASVYDIMRVAGFGSNPYTVWTEIKLKLSDFQIISKTSDELTSIEGEQTAEPPMIKTHNFERRGQRKLNKLNQSSRKTNS